MELLILDNGKLDSISLDDLKKALGLDAQPVVDSKPPVVVEPAKPYGYPRTQVGTTDQGLPVITLTGDPDIWIQIGDNPDRIAPRGTNLAYKSLPGVPRPTGMDTAWSGNTPPARAKQPNGYEIDWFDKDKKEPYYRQIQGIPAGVPIIQTDHVILSKNGSGSN